jgi:HEAT repeat protein
VDEYKLESIAASCNLFNGSDIDTVVQDVVRLEKTYTGSDLAEIYNYFLTVCQNPDILMNIIRCLDKIRDKSSLTYLLDILLMKTGEEVIEKFINVRSMAAKAIANLKDHSSVTPLLYCLNTKSEHYKVRLACADALGRIGDRYAVAPLIELVKDEEEKSVYLRESAASALGMLGDIRAIDPLVSILESQKGIWSKFTFLKERIIEALGKMRLDDNDRVFHALKSSLLDESPQVRINAIEALMESENRLAYDVIKECLKDEDDEVKRNALVACYNLTGRGILDEVIKNQDYPDFLKMEAVATIAEYEDNDMEFSEIRQKENNDG